MDTTCYIERLPNELLFSILGYLPALDVIQAAYVCPRWNDIASSLSLVVRDARDVHQASHTHRKILVMAPNANLTNVCNSACNLHTLIVHDRLRFSTAMFSELEHLKHLSHLDVFTQNSVLSVHAIPVVKRLHTLVVNDRETQHKFLEALPLMSRLKQIHMFGDTITATNSKSSKDNISMFRMLERIAFEGHRYTDLTLRIEGAWPILLGIFKQYSNLVALRVYSFWNCQYDFIETFVSNISELKLRVLHLTGMMHTSSKELLSIIQTLPTTIEDLSLSGSKFADEHVLKLAERMPNLRVLELWSTQASAEGLVRLVTSLPNLHKFDVNVTLRIEQLGVLAAHKSLIKLRCSRPNDVSEEDFKKAAGQLVLTTPDALYGTEFLRNNNDWDSLGFCNRLFYHWSVSHM